MSNDEVPPEALPQPPDMTRKVQIGRLQLIGVPLIMLLPLLALLGLFGADAGTIRASGTGIELEVEYPTRFRYKMIAPLEVSVRNSGEEPIPNLTVLIDTSYLDQFSDVTFTPEARAITDAHHIVELTDILPGETRRVSGQVQAERYGQHQGQIAAVTGSDAQAEVTIHTIVFP